MRIHSHQHKSLKHFKEDWKYFFSIRDPISRFISGFYSRKRKGLPLNHNPWTPQEQKAFEYFPEAEDLAEALFTSRNADRALVSISSIFHTRMHQVDFFDGQLDFSIRKPYCIIRVEKFEQDFNFFKQKLGLTLDVKVSNKNSNPNKAPLPNELSKKARENLEIWFARDIQFYRYCERFIAEQQTQ